MIELFFDNKKINPYDFAFHHTQAKKRSKSYSLKISLSEVSIINFIEEYSGCKIDDPNLHANIMENDNVKKSMGLLWNLKIVFFDKIEPKLFSDSIPVFYNITKIYVLDIFLIIEGQGKQ